MPSDFFMLSQGRTAPAVALDMVSRLSSPVPRPRNAEAEPGRARTFLASFPPL